MLHGFGTLAVMTLAFVFQEMQAELWQALLLVLSPVVVGWWLNRKVKEVHFLVNSQMSAALAKIASLEKRLGVPADETFKETEI